MSDNGIVSGSEASSPSYQDAQGYEAWRAHAEAQANEDDDDGYVDDTPANAHVARIDEMVSAAREPVGDSGASTQESDLSRTRTLEGPVVASFVSDAVRIAMASDKDEDDGDFEADVRAVHMPAASHDIRGDGASPGTEPASAARRGVDDAVEEGDDTLEQPAQMLEKMDFPPLLEQMSKDEAFAEMQRRRREQQMLRKALEDAPVGPARSSSPPLPTHAHAREEERSPSMAARSAPPARDSPRRDQQHPHHHAQHSPQQARRHPAADMARERPTQQPSDRKRGASDGSALASATPSSVLSSSESTSDAPLRRDGPTDEPAPTARPASGRRKWDRPSAAGGAGVSVGVPMFMHEDSQFIPVADSADILRDIFLDSAEDNAADDEASDGREVVARRRTYGGEQIRARVSAGLRHPPLYEVRDADAAVGYASNDQPARGVGIAVGGDADVVADRRGRVASGAHDRRSLGSLLSGAEVRGVPRGTGMRAPLGDDARRYVPAPRSYDDAYEAGEDGALSDRGRQHPVRPSGAAAGASRGVSLADDDDSSQRGSFHVGRPSTAVTGLAFEDPSTVRASSAQPQGLGTILERMQHHYEGQMDVQARRHTQQMALLQDQIERQAALYEALLQQIQRDRLQEPAAPAPRLNASLERQQAGGNSGEGSSSSRAAVDEAAAVATEAKRVAEAHARKLREETSAAIAMLESTNASLGSRCRTLDESNKVLLARCKALEGLAAARRAGPSQAEREALEKERAEAAAQLSRATQALTDAEQQRERALRDFDDLQSAHRKALNDMEELIRQRKTDQAMVKQILNENEHFRRELKSMKEALDATRDKYDSLRADKHRLEADLADAHAQLQRALRDGRELGKEVAALRGRPKQIPDDPYGANPLSNRGGRAEAYQPQQQQPRYQPQAYAQDYGQGQARGQAVPAQTRRSMPAAVASHYDDGGARYDEQAYDGRRARPAAEGQQPRRSHDPSAGFNEGYGLHQQPPQQQQQAPSRPQTAGTATNRGNAQPQPHAQPAPSMQQTNPAQVDAIREKILQLQKLQAAQLAEMRQRRAQRPEQAQDLSGSDDVDEEPMDEAYRPPPAHHAAVQPLHLQGVGDAWSHRRREEDESDDGREDDAHAPAPVSREQLEEEYAWVREQEAALAAAARPPSARPQQHPQVSSHAQPLAQGGALDVEMIPALEAELLRLSMEKDRLESDYRKLPPGAGTTMAARQTKEHIERRLEQLAREIGAVRMALRRLNALK